MGPRGGRDLDRVHPGPEVVGPRPQRGRSGEVRIELDHRLPRGVGHRIAVGVPGLVQADRGSFHRPRGSGYLDGIGALPQRQRAQQGRGQGVHRTGVQVEGGVSHEDEVELGPPVLAVLGGLGNERHLLQGGGFAQSGDPQLVDLVEELVLIVAAGEWKIVPGGPDRGHHAPGRVPDEVVGDAIEVEGRGRAVDGVEQTLAIPVVEGVHVAVGQALAAVAHRHGVSVPVTHVEDQVVSVVDPGKHVRFDLPVGPRVLGVVLVHAVAGDPGGHTAVGAFTKLGPVEEHGVPLAPVLGDDHFAQEKRFVAESRPQSGLRLVPLDLGDVLAGFEGASHRKPPLPHVGVEIGAVALDVGVDVGLTEQVVAVSVPVAVQTHEVEIGGYEVAGVVVRLSVAHRNLPEVPGQEHVLHAPLLHRLADEVPHVLGVIDSPGIVGVDPGGRPHHGGKSERGLPVGQILEGGGHGVGGEDEVPDRRPVLRGEEAGGERFPPVHQRAQPAVTVERHIRVRDRLEGMRGLGEPILGLPGHVPRPEAIRRIVRLESKLQFHAPRHRQAPRRREPPHRVDLHRLHAPSTEVAAGEDLRRPGWKRGRAAVDRGIGPHRGPPRTGVGPESRGGGGDGHPRLPGHPDPEIGQAHAGRSLDGHPVHGEGGTARLREVSEPLQGGAHPAVRRPHPEPPRLVAAVDVEDGLGSAGRHGRQREQERGKQNPEDDPGGRVHRGGLLGKRSEGDLSCCYDAKSRPWVRFHPGPQASAPLNSGTRSEGPGAESAVQS